MLRLLYVEDVLPLNSIMDWFVEDSSRTKYVCVDSNGISSVLRFAVYPIHASFSGILWMKRVERYDNCMSRQLMTIFICKLTHITAEVCKLCYTAGNEMLLLLLVSSCRCITVSSCGKIKLSLV